MDHAPLSPVAQRALALLLKRPEPDLQTWRDLAALSVGITQDSPRYRPMLDALTACDEAFKEKDWPGFWRAAEQAKAIVNPDKDRTIRA